MYDVDTLFTLRKETWDREEVNLSELMGIYGQRPSVDIILSKNTVPGYNNGEAWEYEGKTLHDLINPYIDEAYRIVRELSRKLTNRDLSLLEKNAISKQLSEHTKYIDILSNALDISAKNTIVNLFVTNMRDVKNRQDLLTAISFARVSALKAETREGLEELLKTDEFLMELRQAGLIDEYIC